MNPRTPSAAADAYARECGPRRSPPWQARQEHALVTVPELDTSARLAAPRRDEGSWAGACVKPPGPEAAGVCKYRRQARQELASPQLWGGHVVHQRYQARRRHRRHLSRRKDVCLGCPRTRIATTNARAQAQWPMRALVTQMGRDCRAPPNRLEKHICVLHTCSRRPCSVHRGSCTPKLTTRSGERQMHRSGATSVLRTATCSSHSTPVSRTSPCEAPELRDARFQRPFSHPASVAL